MAAIARPSHLLILMLLLSFCFSAIARAQPVDEAEYPAGTNPDDTLPTEPNPEEPNPEEPNPDETNPEESFPEESNPDEVSPEVPGEEERPADEGMTGEEAGGGEEGVPGEDEGIPGEEQPNGEEELLPEESRGETNAEGEPQPNPEEEEDKEAVPAGEGVKEEATAVAPTAGVENEKNSGTYKETFKKMKGGDLSAEGIIGIAIGVLFGMFLTVCAVGICWIRQQNINKAKGYQPSYDGPHQQGGQIELESQ